MAKDNNHIYLVRPATPKAMLANGKGRVGIGVAEGIGFDIGTVSAKHIYVVWPQRPLGRVAGRCSQGDGCRAVPLNPLIRCVTRKPPREKDYDLGLRNGDHMPHTYPV
jgi:hypothetical protein